MTIVDISTTLPHMEFGHDCTREGCTEMTEWAVWVSHTTNCAEGHLFMCQAHKDLCEQAWILCLAAIPGPCPDCDEFMYVGNLRDHFRAIRL